MQSVFIPAKTNRGARDLSSLQRRSWRMRREAERGRLDLWASRVGSQDLAGARELRLQVEGGMRVANGVAMARSGDDPPLGAAGVCTRDGGADTGGDGGVSGADWYLADGRRASRCGVRGDWGALGLSVLGRMARRFGGLLGWADSK